MKTVCETYTNPICLLMFFFCCLHFWFCFGVLFLNGCVSNFNPQELACTPPKSAKIYAFFAGILRSGLPKIRKMDRVSPQQSGVLLQPNEKFQTNDLPGQVMIHELVGDCVFGNEFFLFFLIKKQKPYKRTHFSDGFGVFRGPEPVKR